MSVAHLAAYVGLGTKELVFGMVIWVVMFGIVLGMLGARGGALRFHSCCSVSYFLTIPQVASA